MTGTRGPRDFASSLPPDWNELSPLVDAVLDAPREQRADVIREVSGGNAQREAALKQIVADCELDTPLFARPAGERFASLFDDAYDLALPEVLDGTYRIEREVGRGGMGRVYLAHDAKHSRRVAVKVIRPDLAAAMGRERFLTEIGIASRLRHPNIVPLYDSGDSDGVLFFVMPFEPGLSLRTRLRGPVALTLAERISILRDVARALAHAHEQGIVHRDVKPDNVMLSGGAAVVTDFGISLALSAAQDSVMGGRVPGGTPAYMAPEQAAADPSADHRADIYSFGCLAYELFSGHPPFHGLQPQEVIAAHRDTIAPPLLAKEGVPDDLAVLIARCLAKMPDDRPRDAGELLEALDRISFAGAAPDVSRSRAARLTWLALTTAAVIVTGYLWTRNRTAPTAITSDARTVAVLSMRSPGGDSLQQELGDGLSDDIASALFKVPGIHVVSRRGAGNIGRRSDLDPKKVGKELGARFLLMESLRETGGRDVVLSQLVDATDGRMVWSDRIDRVQADLEPVRDEISRAVAVAVRHTLGDPPAAAPSDLAGSVHSVDPDAYRIYLLAQRALSRRGNSVGASAKMFRQAIQIDTLYANAYSGLSLAIALSPHFQSVSAVAVAEEASSTARRALSLDSTLSQPHVALGLVYQFAYDWDRAGAEFRKAVSLDGRDVEARVQYGRHLLFRDRPTEALQQFLAARAEDPASAVVASWVSYAYYIRGLLDSALTESDRAFHLDSTNATTLSLGALIRLKAGRAAEALDFVNRGAPTESVFYVLAALGDSAAALTRLAKFEKLPLARARAETDRAYIMLGAHDTTQALAALERATSAREIWPMMQSTRDPIFDPIRASPRFQNLLRRVGLR